MSPSPNPLYQSVSNTFSMENLSLSESRNDVASNIDEGSATSNLASPRIHSPLAPDTGGATTFRARANDVCFVAGISIMLLWPWVFLAIIWIQGGVQMSDHVAKVVKNHPQRISFFITLLGNIVSIIVGIIFSTVIVRFSQQWATHNDHVTVFDVSLISAFKNQSWPWGIKDHKYLLVRKRWLPVVLAGACMAAFALVPSGTTSLITPVSFNRMWPLTGTEFDISLTIQCGFGLPIGCDFPGLPGQSLNDCHGDDQLVELLESGRSNIQSLFSNNSESLILGRLGTNYSIRFLGPPRGVLPIGPNGISGVGTLQPSPLSDADTNAAILSYNYTLYHPGITTNVSCIYDTQSPIRFSAVPNDTSSVEASGSCDEIRLANLGQPLVGYVLPLSTYQTLALWACMSLPNGGQDPTHYIYLRGRGSIYEKTIGNISCTVPPVQPAIFPVMYQSTTRIFSTQERNTTPVPGPSNVFSFLIEDAILILAFVVQNAQTASVNLVADSVDVLGTQAMGGGAYKQYLPLYEAMIQGMLVDEFTFLRFLGSTSHWLHSSVSLPASCHRTVNGIFSAEVTGWVAKPVHIGFLMPMTILNLVSLIIVWISIARAKSGCHEFDLTDPRSLVSAESSLDESDHSGWADGVSYRSRESAMFRNTTEQA